MQIWIEKSRARLNPNIEHEFITDKIEKNRFLIVFLKRKNRSVWRKAIKFLSFFDLIRLCRYIASIDQRKEKENETKNRRNLAFLRRHRFSDFALFTKSIVFNFSNYKLTTTEEFVLKYGLNFCLPPDNVKRHEVFIVGSSRINLKKNKSI